MNNSKIACELIKFFEDNGYPNIAEMVIALDGESCNSVIYCEPYVSMSRENEISGIVKGVLSESFVIGSPAGDCSPLEALQIMATEPNNDETLVYVEKIACTIAYSIRNNRCLLENGYIIRI